MKSVAKTIFVAFLFISVTAIILFGFLVKERNQRTGITGPCGHEEYEQYDGLVLNGADVRVFSRKFSNSQTIYIDNGIGGPFQYSENEYSRLLDKFDKDRYLAPAKQFTCSINSNSKTAYLYAISEYGGDP